MPDFLSPDFLRGLYIIPVLAVLILIHEIGHFVTARMVGVTVEEFGLGIPPRAKGWRYKGVLWSLNWIPFGGFVRVLGEDGASMEPGSMNTKSPAQRAFFLAAGSGMNFLLAILLMILVVGVQGISHENVYVGDVRPNSPAEAAGLQVGDRIVEAAGERVRDRDELAATAREFAGRRMSLVVERDGQPIEREVAPREDPPPGEGPTGVGLVPVAEADLTVESLAAGAPAAEAGLQAGDRIVSINGRPVDDSYVFGFELREAEGATVDLVVRQDGVERPVQVSVPRVYPRVSEVEADSAAAAAGWQAGDRLITIAGTDVARPTDLLDALERSSGQTVPVTVERATGGGSAQRLETRLTLGELEAGDTALSLAGVNIVDASPLDTLGLAAEVEPRFERVSAGRVIPTGFARAFDATRLMIGQIRELVTNRDQWDQVAGPIGMGQITSYALEVSPFPVWVTLANLAIVLSLNLGILNLLPLPALDGGRLLFVIIEILRGGRRIAPEKEGLVHFVGLVLLLGLMGIIAFADVNRLLSGTPFGP